MYKENSKTAIAKKYYSFSMAYAALTQTTKNEVRKEIGKSTQSSPLNSQ